jgi:anti-sigma regulatory factor (Ser/Thr protein kinase)
MDMHESRITFAPSPSAPREARRFAGDVLDACAYRGDPATVVLLVSELVSNGVLHGRGEIELVVGVKPDLVTVRVRDDDPEHLPEVHHPVSDDPRGRGMLLVDRLATAWGVERLPGGQGKQVWFSAAAALDVGD